MADRRPASFPKAVFEARWAALHEKMQAAELDAILCSNLANLRYLTGHAPIIGLAPTRPWYAVLPADQAPMVIVPELGLADMAREGTFGAIHTWPSPRPNGDEGVAEVAGILRSLRRRFGRIGAELGRETRIGTTWSDMTAIGNECGFEIVDASDAIQAIRATKDVGEVAKIAAAARAAQNMFDQLPALVVNAQTERDLHREANVHMLRAGADAAPYLAIGSGPGGYGSLTRGPTDRKLTTGDVIGLDTGTVVDGYWSDYNRNAAIGDPGEAARRACTAAQTALDTALATIRPGLCACDLWRAMADILPASGSRIGRLGHGVGLDYTEPPSIHPDDETVLRDGMVLAIEPSLSFQRADGTEAVMVCEELIHLRDDGPVLLSRRAGPDLPSIGQA